MDPLTITVIVVFSLVTGVIVLASWWRIRTANQDFREIHSPMTWV